MPCQGTAYLCVPIAVVLVLRTSCVAVGSSHCFYSSVRRLFFRSRTNMETEEATKAVNGGEEGERGGERMFTLKKWNAVAMWSWDVECDTCAICRVQVCFSTATVSWLLISIIC